MLAIWQRRAFDKLRPSGVGDWSLTIIHGDNRANEKGGPEGPPFPEIP